MRGQLSLIRSMSIDVAQGLRQRVDRPVLFESGEDLDELRRGVRNFAAELDHLKDLADALEAES
jgi:hypothetical protein